MEFLTLVAVSLVLPLLLSPLIVPSVTTAQVVPSEEETEKRIEKDNETTITITEDNGQTTTYTWEEYTRQKKAAEEAERRAVEYEEMRRKERKKRDELYQKYETKYFVYDYKVYPKLNGKDPDVIGSHLWDEDPYSYSQDVYYRYVDNFGYKHGRVLQWIDKNIVLCSFSIRSLGMVIIDRSIDANPFHRSDIFYQYIGVYDYTTVSGMYNVVPVFKIVYPLDIDY